MRNRSPEVRKARAAAKYRRSYTSYLAGRIGWRASNAAWGLWCWWSNKRPGSPSYGRRPVTFRRQPSDDIPF